MSNEGGGFVIDMTVDRNRRFVQMRALIGRLRIEASTGMTSKISSLRVAQRDFDVRARTKKGALRELEVKFAQEFPEIAGTKTDK